MAKDFFEAHFYPERHTRLEVVGYRLTYYLAALMFNAFPIPRREPGTKETLRYIGELVLHRSWRMARPGRVDVTFGAPLTLKGDDYVALAKQVEHAVRSLHTQEEHKPWQLRPNMQTPPVTRK